MGPRFWNMEVHEWLHSARKSSLMILPVQELRYIKVWLRPWIYGHYYRCIVSWVRLSLEFFEHASRFGTTHGQPTSVVITNMMRPLRVPFKGKTFSKYNKLHLIGFLSKLGLLVCWHICWHVSVDRGRELRGIAKCAPDGALESSINVTIVATAPIIKTQPGSQTIPHQTLL